MSDLLTVKEAAARQGCSVASIYAAITDGRLAPYTAPGGRLHVWAAEVDALEVTGRIVNTSKGEPVLTEAEVPGDDDAVRRGFDEDEIAFLSYALAFTLSRDMLHVDQVPIAQRLTRRFDRMTTGGTP